MCLASILHPFPVWGAPCCQNGQNVCTLLSILSILGRKRSRSKDPDFLPVSILDSKQVSYTYGPYREQPYGVAIYYQRLEWLMVKPNGFMCRLGGQEPREDHSMRWFCTLLHQAGIYTVTIQ